MDMKKMKESMDLAKQLASKEDDKEYRIAAYHVLLDHLLSKSDIISHSDGGKVSTGVKDMKNSTLTTGDNEFEKIMDMIDVDKLSNVKELESILDKCLVLLDYINDMFPNNAGLLIDEIRDIFIDKFGLTTITNDAIRMSLVRNTGKFVTRKKIPGLTVEKYKYKILTAGKEYVKTVKQSH